MPIVSSSYTLDAHLQADGTRDVRESHTDNHGVLRHVFYRLASGQGATQADAFLAARVAGLNAQLAAAEFEATLESSAVNLSQQTKEDFAAKFWALVKETYQSGDKFKFARLVWRLYNWVQAGHFTNNQVRLSFNDAYNRNLSSAEWVTFTTTTLLPIRDRYQAMLDQGDL